MDFLVELEIFAGPLDLLLYLVRRHEVEIVELPIAPITDQFLEYLAVIEQLDVDAVGEFLEMASTLIEIKSRMLLPHGDEIEEPLGRSAARIGRAVAGIQKIQGCGRRCSKSGAAIGSSDFLVWPAIWPLTQSPTKQPVREVEFGICSAHWEALLSEREQAKPSRIVYDDTPIHVYLARIAALLRERGRLAFSELVSAGRHKSAIIGMFFAMLELVRHHGVRVEQNEPSDEIWILAAA